MDFIENNIIHIAVLFFLVMLFKSCNEAFEPLSLGNGYFVNEAFNVNGYADFLYKEINGSKTEVLGGVLMLGYQIADHYFVGIGIPSEMIFFTCNNGGSKGFSYSVEDEMAIFVVNMESSKEVRLSSLDELYGYLDMNGISIKGFDLSQYEIYKKGLMSSGSINQSIGKGCVRANG